MFKYYSSIAYPVPNDTKAVRQCGENTEKTRNKITVNRFETFALNTLSVGVKHSFFRNNYKINELRVDIFRR